MGHILVQSTSPNHISYSGGCKKRKEKPMSGNPTWIWARWLYHAQESSWCRVGFNANLAVGGLLFIKIYEIKWSNNTLYWYLSTMCVCWGGGSIGSCLLSSLLLLSTRYVRYLMAIWWVVFIGFYIIISDVWICRFSRSFMLLVWMAPLTPTVITTRDLIFQPCALITSTD